MASGTPVVASDATALPETCGGAARLAPPDGEAFAAALTEIVSDEPMRARLTAAGFERAAPFTWDATARAVDALLSGAAAPPSAGTRAATGR